MEKFIKTGATGTAIRISDTGREGSLGRTLVLLHGYLESLDVWESFISLMRPYFRVIAPDLPGHGISEVKGPVHTMEFLADTVAGALDELGVGKCVLAGHSMGGYAALEFLRKYPERLDGFVLMHSTPNADTEAKKELREREIAAVEGGKKELLAPNIAARFAPGNRERLDEEIEDLVGQISLTEDAGIAAILRGMAQRRDLNGMLRESKVPELVILGRADELIPPEVAAALVEKQPQAKVVWLEDSGHMGFIEQPQETAQAIIDFAGSLP